MERRHFIKIMAGGSGVILVPSILNGCGENKLNALDGWNGHSKTETDIRIIVLSYAILAPNPHNKQPWIIHLKSPDHFDLYVDTQRLLPQTDPPFRQIHIGHGTFLENLSLAALNFGYDAEITYFPKGMYENTVVENKPVASVSLVRNTEAPRDPLFDQLLARQSNKREYENINLSPAQLEEIKAAVNPQHNGYILEISNNINHRQKLSAIATEAMEIESSDRKRDQETIEMFRFNDKETEFYRDGFGVAQSGMTGATKFIAETFFISRNDAEADSAGFGKEAVELTRKQAGSAAAFGWLVTTTNTREDQVRIGRVYNRINLAATAAGVSIHPMSQVLQEYPDMSDLQKEFKAYLNIEDSHTAQMFFRLGVADPVRHSARRGVGDFLQRTSPGSRV